MKKDDILKIKFLSINQVAQILDVSERTVMRRLDAGCFIAIKEGGRYRVIQSSLEEYVRKLLDEAGASSLFAQ